MQAFDDGSDERRSSRCAIVQRVDMPARQSTSTGPTSTSPSSTCSNSCSLHRSNGGASSGGVVEATPVVTPEERRVLVIYTGGTIGMMRNEHNVLEPCPGVIENRMRSFPNMHDAAYAKTRFRFPDTSALVLPLTELVSTRVIYSVYEYVPLLDSSNMTMDDWVRIARDIRRSYQWFDGFVVLHGTDTMAYTASALSFMLENIGKSVVITGSQIPIFETRSDGRDNLIVALIFAGLHTIPEVAVYFNHALYRGNRTTKLSTSKLSAFGSPNLPPLATVGIHIKVNKKLINRATSISKFEVHTSLCRHVGLLRLFPSITTETVRAFMQPPMSGVVLQSYGSGNVPSNRDDLIGELAAAAQRGVLIVNCTQCLEGSVAPFYETSRNLAEVGVLSGADMTPEAALTKLAYVLSKDEWSVEVKRQMMMKDIRGELTSDRDSDIDDDEDNDLVSLVARQMNLNAREDRERLRRVLDPALMCNAAQNDSIDTLEKLVNQGSDVNACDYAGRTALHTAAAHGCVTALRWLLQHGASVHVRDCHAVTPLQLAVHFEHSACVSVLVECGAHIVLPPAALGERMCSAALAGKMATLQGYLLADVDVNVSDATGRTALHMAAISGKTDVCRLLLSHGARPAAVDVLGLSAVDCARQAGHYGLERLLRRSAGPPTRQNSRSDDLSSNSDAEDDADADLMLSVFIGEKFDEDVATCVSAVDELATSSGAFSPLSGAVSSHSRRYGPLACDSSNVHLQDTADHSPSASIETNSASSPAWPSSV